MPKNIKMTCAKTSDKISIDFFSSSASGTYFCITLFKIIIGNNAKTAY